MLKTSDLGSLDLGTPLFFRRLQVGVSAEGPASAQGTKVNFRGRLDAPSQWPTSFDPYKSFLYQAASWNRARLVVAKVEFYFGELFPRVGFIVTNLAALSRGVVRFYDKRGTAEQWIKEGKQAVKMTRLSCYRFRSNEVRLWLSLIAYNVGNLWRRLVLPARIDGWSLTSLQQRLVKNRRTVDQARTLLLAAACGESSDAAALWRHAAEDRGAAIARGIGDPQGGADVGDAGGWRAGELSAESIGKNGNFGRCVTAWGRTGQLRHRGKRFALQFGLELAFADRLVSVRC